MFTGLIETVGILEERTLSGSSGRLIIRPGRPLTEPVYGESIAVNGACLTLEEVRSDGKLVFHTLGETLSRTNLGMLEPGAAVNLERALRVGDRLGGHFVSGHIDGIGEMISVGTAGGDVELRVAYPAVLRPYLIEKGSIAIDGVSLTLVEAEADFFSVRLIPVTLRDTALRERAPGAPVNLEADMLGKYVERQLRLSSPTGIGGVTMEKLIDSGW